MVGKWAVMGSLVLAVCVGTANAQYQWFENFEDGLAGWNVWTERGTAQSAAEAEPPTLGDIQPWSGANETVAHVGGENYNGGIWQVITLPLGAGTYEIDGFWRSHPTVPSNQWGEVIIREGNAPPVNGSDVAGPLYYKNDTWTTSGGWSGLISATAPVANVPSFTTASGTITLILKSGNVPNSTASVDFDDIWITPEPASLGLFAIGGLVLVRRRRA